VYHPDAPAADPVLREARPELSEIQERAVSDHPELVESPLRRTLPDDASFLHAV
jgi:hypothetical protein